MQTEQWYNRAFALTGLFVGVIIGLIFGLYANINQSRLPQPVDRRIVAHETHRGIAVVDRELRLMVCTDCGVVFMPFYAGLAMSAESWERVQPAEKQP